MQIRTSPSNRISALSGQTWQRDSSGSRADKTSGIDAYGSEGRKPERVVETDASRPVSGSAKTLNVQDRSDSPREERLLLAVMPPSNRAQRALASYTAQQNPSYQDFQSAYPPLAGVDFYA